MIQGRELVRVYNSQRLERGLINNVLSYDYNYRITQKEFFIGRSTSFVFAWYSRGKIHLNFASSSFFYLVSLFFFFRLVFGYSIHPPGRHCFGASFLSRHSFFLKSPFSSERGSFRWNAITRVDEKLKFLGVIRIRSKGISRSIGHSISHSNLYLSSNFFQKLFERKVEKERHRDKLFILPWPPINLDLNDMLAGSHDS